MNCHEKESYPREENFRKLESRTSVGSEPFALSEAALEDTPPVASIQLPNEHGETSGLKLKCAVNIVDKKQDWLVDQFIPADTLIVLAGQVGLGKTTAALSVAAHISNGAIPIIGGSRESRNVLMLTNEDSEAQVRQSFVRLGGNLLRLFVEDEESDHPWGLDNIPALEAHIGALKPALVIIDSLSTHKPRKCDLNSHGDIAPVLVALRKVATKFSCAILVIHHLNKLRTTDPLEKISGSIGITATARHVLFVATHPEDSSLRVIAVAKSNLVKPGAPSFQFRLDPFEWEGASEFIAEDLLPSQEATGDAPNAADVFLRTLLSEGPMTTDKIFKLGHLNRISRAALYNAKRRLGITGSRSAFQGVATWALPSISTVAPATRTGTLGELSNEESSNDQCLQGSSLESLESQLSQSVEMRI